MSLQLNPYQQATAQTWFMESVARRPDLNSKSCGGPYKFVPFPCEVPGMAAVRDRAGNCVLLLYPQPRPVPKDPMFQHAKVVLDDRHNHRLRSFVYGHRAMWRDPAWAYGFPMDAPDEMPAGSVQGFDHGDDIYGADQTTFYREELC